MFIFKAIWYSRIQRLHNRDIFDRNISRFDVGNQNLHFIIALQHFIFKDIKGSFMPKPYQCCNPRIQKLHNHRNIAIVLGYAY